MPLLRRIWLWLLAVLLSTLGVALRAHAEDRHPPLHHYEVWAGADVATDVWLVYSGTTVSPFGDLAKDGLRLRFAGGYGKYSYSGNRISLNPAYAGQDSQPMFLSSRKTFKAQARFAEALIGYQWRWAELTTKAFVGIASIEHDIHPGDYLVIPKDVMDPSAGPAQVIFFNRTSGHEIGWKGVLELWLNLGSEAYASLDLSWADAHLTRSARTRIGHSVFPEVLPGMSAGVEANFNLNRDGEASLKNYDLANETPLDYARFGGFARYAWDAGEFSASAGLVGNFTKNQSAYATVNWITKF